jgi:hypothetical protein
MQTVPHFDRIGEENAFTVLARAAELAAGGMEVINCECRMNSPQKCRSKNPQFAC